MCKKTSIVITVNLKQMIYSYMLRLKRKLFSYITTSLNLQ
jgi:hypothetical protein